jgi:hypothetical protein
MTEVAFTGTREGMTPAQLAAMSAQIALVAPTTFHHGDCIGAVGAEIHGHPSTLEHLRAFRKCHINYEPAPPLERNRLMVNMSSILFAAPKGPEEQRSGTWSTVRFARKRGREIRLVWPDGSVQLTPRRHS